MRLLIITQFFAPEPVPKVEFLARSLVERGYQVTVLTGLPCYPEGSIYAQYRGKYFFTESIHGIEIIRVPQIPDHSSNPLRRIAYYLSFPIFAGLRLLTLARREFDVAYFYGAAVPILALAPFVRRILQIRCLFDVVDLWPESVESSGMLRSPLLLRMLSGLSGFLYRRADHLGVVTNGYKQRLIRHAIPENRISVVHYCVPDLPACSKPNTEKAEFVVAFTGMIGRPQNLGILLDSAKLLLSKSMRILILVAGSGVEYDMLLKRRDSEGIHNVKFLGRLPSSAMPDLYSQADALLVHLKPDRLSIVSIPSKTYSYMAAAKPIIMAVDGEAGYFIEENECGVKVKAGDANSLADAIVYVSEMTEDARAKLGENARNAFESKFSPESHVLRWEELFQRFCKDSPKIPSTTYPMPAKEHKPRAR